MQASSRKTTQPSVPLPLRPETAIDRIVLEIREFIAGAIFFNTLAAEKVGLGLTDMQMLNMLQLYGPTTPGKLAGWTKLTSGGVTVALDRLEKGGYLKREPNPHDRRSLLVTLLPANMQRLQRMYQGVEDDTRDALSTLSQADQDAVLRFFDVIHTVQSTPDQKTRPQL